MVLGGHFGTFAHAAAACGENEEEQRAPVVATRAGTDRSVTTRMFGDVPAPR